MRKRLFLGALLCVVLCSLVIPFSVNAREPVVPETPVSLSLTYKYNESVFQGLDVKIYRVADIAPNGLFGLTEQFFEYPLEVNTVKSQSEWKQIAETVYAYVVADSIVPTASAVTDENGKVGFERLETGLYMVERQRVDYEKGYCSFDSFMLVLPALQEDGTWNYNVEATPKSAYTQTQPDDIEYSILKLWKDAGHETARPASVAVKLYKDGKLAESLTLSADNNWSYSWTAPDDGAVWTVIEENVAKGYTVTTENKDNTFVITNTYSKNPPPPITGDTFSLGIYVMAAIIAGLGLIVLGVVHRNRT